VIADSHGNLFGTTAGGGSNRYGSVFEIVKTAHGYASTPTTVASGFVPSEGAPNGTLIADSHGDLFGTTFLGGLSGAHGVGSVFEIVKTAHGYASTPTTLGLFSGGPESGLIVDAHGNLFGTAAKGGANDAGTVFEIAKTAHGYASTPTTLASFNGTDGYEPVSLIADSHGDLFGTTGQRQFVGANGDGTVFEITDSGFAGRPTDGKGVEGSFSAQSNGSGAPPAYTHDSFVFAPNLGENTSVHSNMHNETVDHAKSEFADFAALLAQAHGDGAHQTAHDATDVTDHSATLAAQHAHHFLV
jgi:uncharacterized repeat protein (TIGR03803 family)